MKRRWFASVVAVTAFTVPAAAGAGWFSDEQPPAGAKPLSEIVRAVEDQKLGAITEVEFDDGVWKIEIHKPEGGEIDLRVDPVSGQIAGRK